MTFVECPIPKNGWELPIQGFLNTLGFSDNILRFLNLIKVFP